MEKTRVAIETAFLIFLILTPLASLIRVQAFSQQEQVLNSFAPEMEQGSMQEVIQPIIYRNSQMDKDLDGIQDSLEVRVSQRLKDERSSLPVVVTLHNSPTAQELTNFAELGGMISHVYRYVAYGFAGTIPAANIPAFADKLKNKLVVIEYDQQLRYHLDVGTTLIRARPTVWDTGGYRGSPNQSIAILDTGIDDSHVDLGPFQDLNFSKKIVGWYDPTPDSASTPEDYGEHGTHVAGIAAGSGAANPLQDTGDIQTTFTYVLPPVGYGYPDYIDIENPGFIQISTRWSGPNTVLLRLYNPAGSNVAQKSGSVSPLTLKYSTVGTSYPTGRYRVLVGNSGGPQGTPFSTVETYPYKGLNDTYNLFSGVAPDSKLVGVKVFDNTGSGTLSTLIDAMDWVIQNRKTYRIVVASMSLSLEYGATDSSLDQKADTMVKNGIVTTVSAGNEYPAYTIASPGTAAYVITVAATNDQNGITSYSSNGDQLRNEYGLIKPDVAAPGGTFDPAYGNRIISADSNDVDAAYSGFSDQNLNDYQQMGGTSMSAPQVAGLAALVIQALGGWSWTQEEALKVKMLVSMTAFETQSGEGSNVPTLNRGSKDGREGYGLVSADAAIEAATMSYSVGEEVNGSFGLGPLEKNVWARQVYLTEGTEYKFDLSIPVDSDYDLFMYNGTPDTYGQPVILAKSVNASIGIDEIIQFTSNTSGFHYIVAKRVSGSGTFNLSSTTITPSHDVAITNVTASTTEVYVGDTVNVTVTALNRGQFIENFSVTVFYNNSTVGTQDIVNLAVGASENLTFDWNTIGATPCNNYTIKAEASVVPEEADATNNVYIDGSVKVKMVGDITGDGVVDIFDLSIVGLAFGFFEWEPEYDPVADLNRDGVVDTRDVATVARNYGNSCV
jgi:subtilisin family serine protease